MDEIICEKCGEAVPRLDTAIEINGIIICDNCYMNMSVKEAVEFFGGRIIVAQ